MTIFGEGRGQTSQSPTGAPLADCRRAERALRARPRRARQAALRPVRGDLGGRRGRGRPGPEQHIDNFRLVFDQRFLDTVVARMDDNEAIFKRILDDEEFRHVLMDLYASRVVFKGSWR